MAKDFSKRFYNSKSWQNTRNAFFKSKYGICELCGKPGEEVHHVQPITPDNINNSDITLSWNNLQLLCRSCHELIEEKAKATVDGLKFSEDGQLVEEIRNDNINII